MKALLSTLLGCSPCLADLVNTTFTLTAPSPGFNSLNLTLQSPILGNASDSSDLSGTIQATLDIDPATGIISSIEFTGGNLQATPVTFTSDYYTIQTTTLAGLLDTPAPPALVTDGKTDADLHELIINSGTASGDALGIPVFIDFSTESLSGEGNSGGVLFLTATENTMAAGPLPVYNLTLSYPARITELYDVATPLGNQSVIIAGSGNVYAEGTASFPTNAYTDWTTANDIPGEPFNGDINGDGIPTGLAWALGYSATARVAPLTVSPNGDLTVQPGPDGLRAPVTIETSTTLLPSSFSEAPSQNVSPGTNPLSNGQMNPVSVSGLSGLTRFFRLTAQDPGS